MSPLRPVAALCAAFTLFCAGPAVASTYYVSPTGSDSASGSATAPFKTADKALKTVVGGDVVLVAPGSYAAFTDSRAHVGVRLTALNPATPPVFHGAGLYGAAGLTIDHVAFDGNVLLRTHPTNATKFAHDITIADSSFATTATCLTVRNGSYDVTVRDNHFTGCYVGVLGPGDGVADPAARPMAHNVQVLDNTIEHLTGDGIQIGNWDDSVIDGNVIRDAHDPNHVNHNDGIQIMGNTHRLRVSNNTLSDSTQLLFAQNALGGNDGLVATGNLILGGWGYSVQLFGTRNITFANNTVWDSTYGVIFRDGATGTWSHNIIDRYVPGAGAMSDTGYNLTYARTAGTPALSDLLKVDPMFVDPAHGDYHLLAGSPALSIRAGAFLP